MGGVQLCGLDVFAARQSLAALLRPADLEESRVGFGFELTVLADLETSLRTRPKTAGDPKVWRI